MNENLGLVGMGLLVAATGFGLFRLSRVDRAEATEPTAQALARMRGRRGLMLLAAGLATALLGVTQLLTH
jgi:hypothetical protein